MDYIQPVRYDTKRKRDLGEKLVKAESSFSKKLLHLLSRGVFMKKNSFIIRKYRGGEIRGFPHEDKKAICQESG
jgi:hypothetical protein